MDFMLTYVRLTYRTSRVAITMLLWRDFCHLQVDGHALPSIIGRVRLLMRSVFTRNQI